MTENTKEQLIKEIFEATKNTKVDMKTIKELAEKHPDRLIYQEVKSPEEFQERNTALYYSMQGDYEKSIVHATAGLKINPNSVYLVYMRGRSKGDLGQFEEGLKDLTEAIKMEPKYAEAFVERGYISQKMGDLSGARSNYGIGIRLDHTLQEQVDEYLSKNSSEKMAIPSGVTFKFIVTPSISKYHQRGIKYFIITKSGLSQYFKNIDITFCDGCYIDNQGRSITDDVLKGKQMLAKVLCPEPTVAIEKSKEEYFYKQIKEKYSEWIIDLI